MKTHILKNPGQMGGYTHLFILGTKRNIVNLAEASDFTEATNDTAQSFTLTALKKGDQVLDISLDVPINVAGLTACTALLGVTGDTDLFLDAANLLAAGSEHYIGDTVTGAALTDNSGGTANDTIAAITTGGAAADQGPTRDAIADLAAKINGLRGPYVATADTNLLLTLDPASNGEALADITAGEIYVWARISRKSDRITDRYM